MSISNRLRWSYLITSTIPLLLVGALLIVVLFRVQQRNAYAAQQAFAEQVAGNLSTFLYDLDQQLLRSARELSPDATGPLLNAQAGRIVTSATDLRALVVVNAAGEVVAQVASDALDRQGVAPAPIDQRLLRDAISVGKGVRTTIVRAPDGLPFFQVVLPIREQPSGALLGAVSAEVSAARVSQILRQLVQGQDKAVYLVDAERQLMLSDRARGWTPPPDLSALFAEEQTVGEYMAGDGQIVLGARASISPVTAASWSVVVEQPSSEFFVEVYRSVFLLAALVGLVGVMALTWALFQSRQIVDPVRALTTGAQELAAGHLVHRIEVSERDELGQLADTFNNMAERLQASLHEIEQQNERLRHGLELARDIQQGLLPSTPPWQTEMLTVFGRSLPASEVGGDFYTYLTLSGGRAAIAIGDISGKGVAAALLMALTSSTLESQARALESPAAMIYALNAELRQRLQANQMNAALQIAVYNPEQATMTVANAGMVAPLLARALPGGGTECCFVEVWGLPIGTRLTGRYLDVEVPLARGDTLIFLSDGIVEAHNPQDELYGFERLEALVASLPPTLGVADVVQRILDAVLAFADGAEPHDDITIIATRPALATPTERRSTPVAPAEVR